MSALEIVLTVCVVVQFVILWVHNWRLDETVGEIHELQRRNPQ